MLRSRQLSAAASRFCRAALLEGKLAVKPQQTAPEEAEHRLPALVPRLAETGLSGSPVMHGHWLPAALGRRTSSTSVSEYYAEQERIRSKVMGSVAEALEIYEQRGRCEKVELPSDEEDGLAAWILSTVVHGERVLKFHLSLESTLSIKLAAAFCDDAIEGMTKEQKLEWANAWSSSKKFTKCFVDADGDMQLEYDVDLEKLSEPSAPTIREAVHVFEISLDTFAVELSMPEVREVMPEIGEHMRKLKTEIESHRYTK